MILMYANTFAYILEKDGERAVGGEGEERQRQKHKETERHRDRNRKTQRQAERHTETDRVYTIVDQADVAIRKAL